MHQYFVFDAVDFLKGFTGSTCDYATYLREEDELLHGFLDRDCRTVCNVRFAVAGRSGADRKAVEALRRILDRNFSIQAGASYYTQHWANMWTKDEILPTLSKYIYLRDEDDLLCAHPTILNQPWRWVSRQDTSHLLWGEVIEVRKISEAQVEMLCRKQRTSSLLSIENFAKEFQNAMEIHPHAYELVGTHA
ncbi:MAG: hypothetical protein WEC84_01605 [Candidatus Andersenbacteria bacterium]